MNEEQTKPATTDAPTADWFLQLLVETANHSEFAVPITLCVGGALITGEMVGGRTYFEGFAQEVKEGMIGVDEDTAEKVASHFRKLGDMYPPKNEADLQEEPKAEEETAESPPHFVHLRNARIFHPGQDPIPTKGRGVWWRGRLEAVDGFILGSLQVNRG